MKQVFFILICMVVLSASLHAQNTDTLSVNTDTAIVKNDSLQSLPLKDTIPVVVSARPVFKLQNRLLNSNSSPVSLSVHFKKDNNKDSLFYVVAGILLVLASLKYFYSRYFTNLFRVFFNTSLRQSQLTDQLLQAKFPSLVFNVFFILSGGFYTYILLLHYKWINEENKWIMMASLIALLGLIYLIKFCTLKFTGWVTGLTDVTNTYVFIIFLINKIIGIFLVPFIVILSFSDIYIVRIAVIISLMSILLLLLLRFFRSYGLLQNQLKISRFHFVLYIAGIELLPLLLIYKGLMIYLSKNL
ncbi:MAG TPA: DUF4271 domain-containing protein [Ferruginibacter sp.]|nr:DUF4271 domain-containing protein [Ferruginibacter sp.]